MSTRAGGGILSVEAEEDLQRVRTALGTLGERAEATMRDASLNQLTAGWNEELAARAAYNRQQQVIVTAQPLTAATTLGMTVLTGGSGRLGFLTRPFEFGAVDRDEFTTYFRTGPGGSRHQVTRRTKRQLPTRSQTGWLAYPAAGAWSKRAYSMLLQIIVKVTRDAIDGASRG